MGLQNVFATTPPWQVPIDTPLTLAWQPYCGSAPTATALWSRWNLDPVLLALLAMVALVLAIFASRLPDASRGRMVAAWCVLVMLFVSPLCAATSALFAFRVFHHLLLVAAAMPLLAWALPPRAPGSPHLAAWTVLQALVFWAWHAPGAYAWTFTSDAAYWLMQATLGASAWLFWRAVRVASAPMAVAALLATTVQMGLLGALLTFAPASLYTPHLLTTTSFGLAPIEDQQLGGLLMWVPASLLYAGMAVARLRTALLPARPTVPRRDAAA